MVRINRFLFREAIDAFAGVCHDKEMGSDKEVNQQTVKQSVFNKSPLLKSKYIPLVVIFFLTIGMVTVVAFISSDKKNTGQNVSVHAQNNSSVQTQAGSALQKTPTPKNSAAPKVSPTNTPTPLPTLDPGVSWYTYSNPKYNYTIKYPPDWVARDLSPLEPLVPSYIVFNPKTASASSRFITIAISSRTYQEQIAIGGPGDPFTAAGINGIKQMFQDSNGFQSTAIVLPRTKDLLIPRAKKEYESVFYIMLSTLQSSR